jgi:origin recognition complex subunit 3
MLTRPRSARLIPLDSNAVPLWDIWYMGTTPFPAELLNPAPRASIYGALLYPHAYVKAAIPVPISIVVTDSTSVPSTPRKNKGDGRAESKSPVKTNARSHTNAAADGQIKLKLHNLPDTSILFRRYLNAGRMINVYDWFESFKLAVDPQRPEGVDEVRSLLHPFLII